MLGVFAELETNLPRARNIRLKELPQGRRVEQNRTTLERQFNTAANEELNGWRRRDTCRATKPSRFHHGHRAESARHHRSIAADRRRPGQGVLRPELPRRPA